MGHRDSADACSICKTGRLATRTEELAFSQSTDKGLVRCQVAIVVAVCDTCKSKTWDGDAEAAIQKAVAEQYRRLP